MPRAKEAFQVGVLVTSPNEREEVADADRIARRSVQRVVIAYNAENLAAGWRAKFLTHANFDVQLGQPLYLAFANGEKLLRERVVKVTEPGTGLGKSLVRYVHLLCLDSPCHGRGVGPGAGSHELHVKLALPLGEVTNFRQRINREFLDLVALSTPGPVRSVGRVERRRGGVTAAAAAAAAVAIRIPKLAPVFAAIAAGGSIATVTAATAATAAADDDDDDDDVYNRGNILPENIRSE